MHCMWSLCKKTIAIVAIELRVILHVLCFWHEPKCGELDNIIDYILEDYCANDIEAP